MSKLRKTERGGHHVKYDPAEQKKNFFRRIESVCMAVAGPGVYEMIPAKDLGRLYNMRVLPIKLEPAPHEQIPDNVIRAMRRYLAILLKDAKVPLFKEGPDITLTEYLSGVEALNYYLGDLRDDAYSKAAAFKTAMEPLSSFGEGPLAVQKKIYDAITAIEITFDDLSSRLYWMSSDFRYRPYGSRGIEHLIMVHSHIPERIHVVSDGIFRPALKLCLASREYEGTIDIIVTPKELGISVDGGDSPMNVYIQAHALQRLAERLDCIAVGVSHLYLCYSFNEPVVHHEKEGTFLIEYRLREKKAGYLVAEIKDGKLIVRTFLFVTNSGTPEGNKLEQICGLGKFDKQFLAIDKLSTFIATDIRSDKELEKLFLESGCGSLLDLHDNVEGINTMQGMTSSMPRLKKYLGLNTGWDFMMPDLLDKVRRKIGREMD